jgi:hypothetical protein
MRVGSSVGRMRRRIIGLARVDHRKAIGGWRGRRGMGIGVDPFKGILGVMGRESMQMGTGMDMEIAMVGIQI